MVYEVDDMGVETQVVVSAKVKARLAETIDARARAEGRTRSAVVAHLLAEAVQHVPVGADGRKRWTM